MARTQPDIITEKEVEILIRSTPDVVKKAVFAIGFYEGLRVSELGALDQKHIDHENHMLHIVDAVTPSGKPKKQVERKIPIFREIDKALQFLPFNRSNRCLQKWYEDQTLLIFGKKGHIHTLRHGCCTWLLNVQGWGLTEVRDMAGHANFASTQTYARAFPERLVKMARGG